MQQDKELNEMDLKLLSLSGLWNILRNTKKGREVIVILNSGRELLLTFQHFDEETGILNGAMEMLTKTPKSVISEQMISELIVINIRLEEISAIGFLPEETKHLS
jgi:small nuclear ribonucleoprotein (snRNP)-like protein